MANTPVGTPASSGRRPPATILVDLLKRFWLPLILVVAALVFIGQNAQSVSVHFLFFEIRSWQWLILTIVAVGGLIAGWVLGRNSARRKLMSARTDG